MNGYYFTDRVRSILEMSRKVAGAWRHDYVGAELELAVSENVSAALNFLMQTGHSSARRDS